MFCYLTILKSLFLLIFSFLEITFTYGQRHDENSFKTDLGFPGYLLFAPLTSHSTLLIDKSGKIAHAWKTESKPAQSSVFITPYGKLLRTGKDSINYFKGYGGGLIELYNWEGGIYWSYEISNQAQIQHHDICLMPNGNILVLLWQKILPEEAIANGRNPELTGEEIWTEKIVELRPIGKNKTEIVWEWKVWDHLVQDFDATKKNYGNVAASPGRFNVNYNASKDADWLHFNGLAFNPQLNQIIVSSAHWNEFYVIDHSTSKTQAATSKGGKSKNGGDILYRWGNAAAYNRGTLADQKLFRQHDAHWVSNGKTQENKIIVFNNGVERMPENSSSIDMLIPPLNSNKVYNLEANQAYGPEKLCWQYFPEEEEDRFYSRNMSGAQTLPNGNILVSEGANGKFFELDKEGHVIWHYYNVLANDVYLKPGQQRLGTELFKCSFYEPNFPGFKGKHLEKFDTH